jgi:hypothetical protein|tara:strand:+ start:190 stop:462 length:273 start_codon:yes stop_codon:yes gene_type:complete
MKVICINDSSKPNKIPNEQWIKKGEAYTVTRIVRLALQQDTMGLLLKEVKMDNSCFPYEFYDADRFAIIDETLVKTEESIKEKEADLEVI